MTTFTMHQLPKSERPRERLKQFGPEVMSTAELIAVILGSGTSGLSVLQLAQELISRFGENLSEATFEELCQVRGMGETKAAQLKAALSLGMRMLKEDFTQKQRISQPDDAYRIVKHDLENEKRELLVVMMLDTKGYLICHEVVSIGTLTQTVMHPREVFYLAVRHKAAKVIIVHNHPSGDPSPSPEDIRCTANLVAVGEMMGIPVDDHIIVGKNTYLSLKEMGVKFV